MNGKDSTADKATHLLLPNMAENTTPTEGGLGLDHGVHTTDTELWKTSYRTLSTGLCHWHTYCPTSRLLHGNMKRWTDYLLDDKPTPKSIPDHYVLWYSVYKIYYFDYDTLVSLITQPIGSCLICLFLSA